MITYSGKLTATSLTKSHSPPRSCIWSTNDFASSSTRTFNARIAFGRNQSAPMALTLRCCGSSRWISVRTPIASCWASPAAVVSTGRGELVNTALSRSTAMMSACLVIAQNGR